MAKETSISKKEIVELLKGDTEELFKKANRIRKEFCGDEAHIRGIIEFSNYCCRSCLYCGLRRENKEISRYRMLPEKIIKLAGKIASSGIKTIVLQSGDDFWYTQQMLCEIISRIKKENPQVAITLCIGERPFGDYKALKNAGTDRYLLKHETANPKLYAKLHPGQTLKRRLKILEYLKKMSYQTGAGNIVGLPGQTSEDLASDILLMERFGIDMAGIGPFIPQKDTPLSNFSSGTLNLTLKVLALTRIVTKNIHLPATTALATLNDASGQLLGLKAGGNVIMPDFTPEYYRKNYVIYNDKVRIDLERAKEIIFKAQRLISKDKGDSLKCKRHKKDYACI